MVKENTPSHGEVREPSSIEIVDGLIADPAARHLKVDVAKYEAYLADTDLSADQKRELIETLWAIMVSFVELGFGVHPLQQIDKTGAESADLLNSDSQQIQKSNQKEACAESAGESDES